MVNMKDPRRPKRNLGPFMLFALDVFPKVLQVNPRLRVPKLAQVAGRLWREIPLPEKRRYLEKAAEGKRRYLKQMKNYVKPSPEELHALYGFKPKQVVSAYCYFVKANFSKVLRRNPEYDFARVVRRLARVWHTLSPEQRLPYVHRSNIDRIRWKGEMHLYKGGYFRHGVSRKNHCGCCQTTGKAVTRDPGNAFF